jgi:hypothetical protein
MTLKSLQDGAVEHFDKSFGSVFNAQAERENFHNNPDIHSFIRYEITRAVEATLNEVIKLVDAEENMYGLRGDVVDANALDGLKEKIQSLKPSEEWKKH